MPLLRPFPGLRPLPQRAAEVLAPPYDVLNTQEARQRAHGRPWSFLHISKPEIDLPEDTDPHDSGVYARGAENLAAMRGEGILLQDPAPCYYVYRLVMGEHEQIGLVAAASVAAYDSGRIRKHEFTRPQKEDDRVRQIDVLDAQTGPVFLVYRSDPEVDAMLAGAASGKPDIDVTADGDVRHSLWVVSDAALIERLTTAFDAMPSLYVADGHHRSAAASRVASARRKANPGHSGEEAYNYFLTVVFPHNQMKILDYNRVVRDLNGHSPESFLQSLEEDFEIEITSEPVRPQRPAEFGMYLPGQWYRLTLKAENLKPDDPVARLDVSLLGHHLIDPILGIQDPRRDARIDFVGGIRGLAELERRVDNDGWAVAFSLFPTRMEDLMAVADSGQVMPPKSTWFEPKLADGMVSHLLR